MTAMVDDQISVATKAYQEKHPGVSFVDAQAAVLQEKPQLYTESVRAQNLRASSPATPSTERLSRFSEGNAAAAELEQGEAEITGTARVMCRERGLPTTSANLATMVQEILTLQPSIYAETIRQQALAIRENA